jgi:acyl carrier protein
MAVESVRSTRGDMLSGVATISTAKGLAALRELLEVDATQAAVMPIDWAEFTRRYPAFAADPFLQAMAGAVSSGLENAGVAGLNAEGLRALPTAERPGALLAYLHVEAARVLGFAPEQFDSAAPLSSFGFDSLMAVQLKNRIEADLGLAIAMIQFLQGLSVEELVPILASAVGEASSASARIVTASEEPWEEGTL